MPPNHAGRGRFPSARVLMTGGWPWRRGAGELGKPTLWGQQARLEGQLGPAQDVPGAPAVPGTLWPQLTSSGHLEYTLWLSPWGERPLLLGVLGLDRPPDWAIWALHVEQPRPPPGSTPPTKWWQLEMSPDIAREVGAEVPLPETRVSRETVGHALPLRRVEDAVGALHGVFLGCDSLEGRCAVETLQGPIVAVKQMGPSSKPHTGFLSACDSHVHAVL